MNHVIVGPDLVPHPCGCDAEIDHGAPLGDQDECGDCQAILDENGRCWDCDAAWIWTTP